MVKKQSVQNLKATIKTTQIKRLALLKKNKQFIRKIAVFLQKN